ncbi:MAG: G1 family glutamic endopeptidase [Terracidiphilus sp.]
MESSRRAVTLSPDSLIPTNVNGVYAFPPPPDDLDLQSAEDPVLANYGIFLPRPVRSENPALVAIWNKITGRKWRTIIPQIGTLTGRAQSMIYHRGPPAPPSQPGFASCNLFSAPGQPWDTVFATWNCPTLSAPPQGLPKGNVPQLALWVALDAGETSNGTNVNSEMLQAGFTPGLNYPSTGDFSVSAPWWMWFPPGPNVNQSGIPVSGELLTFPPIKAGDEVMVQVSYLWLLFDPLSFSLDFKLGLYGSMSIRNMTQSISTSLLFEAPSGATGAGASIEWVMENVNWSNPDLGVAPVVPKFSPVQFSDVGPASPTESGATIFDMQDTTLPGHPTAVSVGTGPNSVTMSFV